MCLHTRVYNIELLLLQQDKTGLTGAMARNIAGLPSTDGGSSTAIANFVASQASEHVEELPDDIYTKEVNLKQSQY